MQKIVAISQSNYIPWKGYFDLIARADEFILYDEAQFTKNDWRNRNIIKTPNGPQWLTIPVHGSTQEKISDVKIADSGWNMDHLKTIRQFYKNAAFYEEYSNWLTTLYSHADFEYLSEVNVYFIKEINRILGIDTPLKQSKNFTFDGDATQKVISMCKETKADIYLSGPAAMNYLNVSYFEDAGIDIKWMNYGNYPEYSQCCGSFDHNVTIIDLLFNTGKNAPNYLNYVCG